MKSDLDRLLQERDLDALVVVGPDGLGDVNAPFRWFVGDAHLTGTVLKKRGSPPVILHSDMERNAAVSSGLEPVSLSRWPLKEIFESFTEPMAARVELHRRIFEDLGIGGRIAVAGVDDVGGALTFWERMRAAVPGLEIAPVLDGGVLAAASLTKDEDELAALERVGRDACAIVDDVRDLLGSAPVSRGVLTDGGQPLTIGRLRARVNEWMHARGLRAPEGFILSANRDAGVPHNAGDDAHALAPGDVLLFDFYPRGTRGYHHDVARTWSLGTPRPEVRAAYEDVLACFAHVMELVRPGASTRELQHDTCAFFESLGHPTIRQDPSRTSGYVHSLGHGLGLEVHERPHFPTFRAGRDTRLEPGMVITIEPGLYDPDRGVGVRIEDTVVVTVDGARSLSPVDLTLEIPLRTQPARGAA